MARFFSSAKALSALVATRGFASAAAPQGVVAKAGATAARSGAAVKKTGEEVVGSSQKVSWVPDPRTGYYRPENVSEVVDVAELRAILLKKH
ncbi:hypothetical protein Tsubulata_021561 [Turnera subulata]|uniref:Uncharacterized protein n=1 Tax=Turnera subulata TaxID=218843 RepID=A0A9Q0GFH2_9ROSI|nr:hypothetical protein Tsubulata_021561 [Turnera subulata]